MKGLISKMGMLLAALAMLAGAFGADYAAAKDSIDGAGATFPYPIYAKWAHKYNELTGMELNYQAIGSGGGIAQIKAKTVDFGASDAPLTAEELEEAGLVQFPMVLGGVVPIVNIKGVEPGKIKLTSDLMADIFLGKITMWNDPRIRNVNPGLNLPRQAITVVHRAEGSGTTWIFTDYLSKVSNEWKQTVGQGKAVRWPTGIAGKGNPGVAAYVKRVNGAIGYVEFAYAVENKLSHAQLRNKAGKYVQPTIDTFMAAAAHADWKNAPGFYMVLTDQPGDESWPITGASYILVYREQKDMDTIKTTLKFFKWCFDNGQDMAIELHYVPIPENVVYMVETKWSEDISVNGRKVWDTPDPPKKDQE